MTKKIFIGVAWPYVNSILHIGHLAGFLLPADIFARFHRFLGNDVLMVSGSDCFGTPITIKADELGVSPKEIVEEYHKKNTELFRYLGISFDLYTRTDTENHKKIVQDFFITFLHNGFIFKNTTKQFFSVQEKRFLPDRYVEGACPHCNYENARSDQCDNCSSVLEQGELLKPRSKTTGSEVKLKETEHYFFDWPKLKSFLNKYVLGKKGKWRDWVFNETYGWLKKELKPRAITRDLDWGIDIPIERIPEEQRLNNIKNKRFYVWFEAVIGYLSGSIEWSKGSEKWKDFWYNPKAEHYYFMGKDNLVFHTLFWPGELYGYDRKLHLPDVPAINQFLNFEGQKFSKSRGVIIDSRHIAKEYGIDPVRFYLASIMPETNDANFKWQDFIQTNNSLLIGNLGNFVNRTLTFVQDVKLDWRFLEKEIEEEAARLLKEAKQTLERCCFKKYIEILLTLSDFGNKYLSRREPWKFKKQNSAENKINKIASNSVYIILGLMVLLKPLVPNTYKKLSTMLQIDFSIWPSEKEIKQSLIKVKIREFSQLFVKINQTKVP